MGRITVCQLLLTLYILCNFVGIHGDYGLEIQLEQYQNPLHLQADGGCCNRHFSSQVCTSCHNKFTFCLLPYKTESREFLRWNICAHRPGYTTAVIGDYYLDGDNVLFTGKKFVDQQRKVPNPLVFNGTGLWPGKFQFIVKVTNWRSPLYEYLVDEIVEDWEMPVNMPFSRRRLTGARRNAILTVQGRVTCTNGLFCNNCTEKCEKLPKIPISDSIQDGNDGEVSSDQSRGQGLDDVTEENSTEGIGGRTEANQGIEEVSTTINAEGSSNSSNAISPLEGVAIGLSVVGILVVLALILTILLVAVYFMMKGGKKKVRPRREERQPFLRGLSGHPASYQAGAGTDEDSPDESLYTVDNPTYGLNGDGFDPRLPPIPLQPPPRRPRIPRNKHTTTSTSSSSSSSSPQLAYSAEYSVIRRRSSDLSPAQSLEDILEASEEEEREAELSDVMDAGYHVIKQENMDAAYMSEAGVSEEEEEEEGVEDERVRGTVTLPLTTSPDVES